MLAKKTLIICWLLFFYTALSAWGAVETIHYTYDDSLQVIRSNYNSSIVVDYIYDGVGNRKSRSVSTNGLPDNNPPTIPASSSPSNGAVSIPSISPLSWTASDPDAGDVLVYDIYLGLAATPQLYKRGHSGNAFQPDRLLPMTTYYWKIVARDNHNAQTEGPVWSFTTGNQAPSIPSYLMPGQGSSVAYGNAYLSWIASDPDLGDTLVYDIYFGTVSSPPLLQSDSLSTVYGLGVLSPGTTYYWRIVAKDSHGSVTSGPVWSFQSLDHAPVTLNTQVTENIS